MAKQLQGSRTGRAVQYSVKVEGSFRRSPSFVHFVHHGNCLPREKSKNISQKSCGRRCNLEERSFPWAALVGMQVIPVTAIRLLIKLVCMQRSVPLGPLGAPAIHTGTQSSPSPA